VDKVDLAVTAGEQGREDTQWFTQGLAATLCSALPMPNRLWLDVGAGLGRSRERIEPHGFRVITQDPAPDLPVDTDQPLEKIYGEFGVVSAFDVIEHVKDVPAFTKELSRLSCGYVVLSAPFDSDSLYHFQVFTPQYLLQQTSSIGRLLLAYELGEGWVRRRDQRIKEGFGALLVYSVGNWGV